MCSTEQMRGVSILHHGVLVWNELESIINKTNTSLPSWFDVDKLMDCVKIHELRKYTILHDCGKPYCLTVDIEGRKHFPNHATISVDMFRRYFDDCKVAKYIGLDMFMHTCSREDIDNLTIDHNNRWLYAGLLLVSFAEIYANCKMFGGPSSTSFKIKYKHLDKRGKVLFNKLF